MNYTLTLNLEGDGAINSALDALKAKVAELHSLMGGAGTVKAADIVSRESVDRIASATRGVSGLKKEVQSLATAAAQGFGKGTIGFLKNLSPDKLAQTLANNPDLAKAWAAMNAPTAGGGASGGNGKFKGVYWTSKEMLGAPRLPDVSAFLPKGTDSVFKGLRDVGGKDLAKVLGLPDINSFNSIKGLATPNYSAALAGIHGMGTIEGHMEQDSKKAEAIRQRTASKAEKDLESFTKNMSLIIGPIFNPGGALTTAFAARQVFSAFTTQKGQSILGKFGLSGTQGAIVGTGVAIGAATVLGLALVALKKEVEAVAASFGRAHALFSAALQNGMGLQFTAKRSALANILGVSEKDIFQFGAQVAYLSPKIKEATDILAKTAMPLTQLEVDWKVLLLDMEATAALVASEIAPAFDKLINVLDGLVKWFNAHFKEFLVLDAIINPGTAALIVLLKKVLGGKPQGGDLPGPQAWMKQLPASHWEHMGLVVGTGGENYPQQIAKNTKDMVGLLKGKGRGNGGIDPKSQWGLMPTVNNP